MAVGDEMTWDPGPVAEVVLAFREQLLQRERPR